MMKPRGIVMKLRLTFGIVILSAASSLTGKQSVQIGRRRSDAIENWSDTECGKRATVVALMLGREMVYNHCVFPLRRLKQHGSSCHE